VGRASFKTAFVPPSFQHSILGLEKIRLAA
jgi:hypothetical protein